MVQLKALPVILMPRLSVAGCLDGPSIFVSELTAAAKQAHTVVSPHTVNTGAFGMGMINLKSLSVNKMFHPSFQRQAAGCLVLKQINKPKGFHLD